MAETFGDIVKIIWGILAAASGALCWLPATLAYGAEETCDTSKSSAWTNSETWIWTQVCASRTGDLDLLAGGPPPASTTSSGWAASRRISSDFLREIVTDPKYVTYSSTRQVRIKGALVEGYLDLSDMISARGLAIEDSRFENTVSLYNAMTSSDVNFSGSTFVDDFLASGAQVGGTLYLDNIRAEKNIDLAFAKVAESLSMSSTVVVGDFDANDVKIERDCILSSDAMGNIRVTEATIGGTLGLYSGIATNVDLSGTSSHDLVVDRGSYEELTLNSADVEEDMTIEDAIIPHVEVYGSRIGDALSLAGLHVEDELVLINSNVGGPLHLKDSRVFTFGSDTSMDLRNLTVGTIEEGPEVWPKNLSLNGFTYNAADGGLGTFIIDRDLSFYRDWLDRDQYRRGPYRNLEDALRAAGRDDEADAIAIERLDREAVMGPWYRWPDRFVFKASVGYGYKPWYAVAPAVILIACGSIVAKHLPLDRDEVPSKVLLSAHLLVPLISFGERYGKVDVTSGSIPTFVRRYFYVHVVLGYVLAAYIAAALARITSR